MKSNLLPIAKEGWKYIGYSFLAFVVFSILGFEILEILVFILSAFLIFVYRNPERESMVYEQNSVVSPVDGIVSSIDEIEEGNTYSYVVTIESNYLDVSLLRVPMSSKIISIKQHFGSRLSNYSKLSKKINENVEISFEDDNNNILTLEHILNQSIAPIDIDIHNSQKVTQGTRYGVMLSGKTTLHLPQNFRLNVSVGSSVKASQSLVGYFS